MNAPISPKAPEALVTPFRITPVGFNSYSIVDARGAVVADGYDRNIGAAIISRCNSHSQLIDGINAVLGLIQLISHRSDLTPQLREVLANNHRVQEAEAAVAGAK